jgi:hypothetical protein
MTHKTTLRILTLAIVIVAGSSFGCAFGEIRPDDWFQRQYSLEEDQKSYTDFVRWAHYEKATAFMKAGTRNEFIESMPDFEAMIKAIEEALAGQKM